MRNVRKFAVFVASLLLLAEVSAEFAAKVPVSGLFAHQAFAMDGTTIRIAETDRAAEAGHDPIVAPVRRMPPVMPENRAAQKQVPLPDKKPTAEGKGAVKR